MRICEQERWRGSGGGASSLMAIIWLTRLKGNWGCCVCVRPKIPKRIEAGHLWRLLAGAVQGSRETRVLKAVDYMQISRGQLNLLKIQFHPRWDSSFFSLWALFHFSVAIHGHRFDPELFISVSESCWEWTSTVDQMNNSISLYAAAFTPKKQDKKYRGLTSF